MSHHLPNSIAIAPPKFVPNSFILSKLSLMTLNNNRNAPIFKPLLNVFFKPVPIPLTIFPGIEKIPLLIFLTEVRRFLNRVVSAIFLALAVSLSFLARFSSFLSIASAFLAAFSSALVCLSIASAITSLFSIFSSNRLNTPGRVLRIRNTFCSLTFSRSFKFRFSSTIFLSLLFSFLVFFFYVIN